MFFNHQMNLNDLHRTTYVCHRHAEIMLDAGLKMTVQFASAYVTITEIHTKDVAPNVRAIRIAP